MLGNIILYSHTRCIIWPGKVIVSVVSLSHPLMLHNVHCVAASPAPPLSVESSRTLPAGRVAGSGGPALRLQAPAVTHHYLGPSHILKTAFFTVYLKMFQPEFSEIAESLERTK